MKSGVLNLNKLVDLSDRYKKSGKRVVVYNGGFDVLHAGHISAIQEAKSKGDVLFVLVNSDKSIASYKGPGRPFISQRERAVLVAAIKGVDAVAIFDDITPIKALEKLKPTIYCSGSDWGKNCIERQTVEAGGGKVVVLKKIPGLSTSNLLTKISNSLRQTSVRAVFLDHDGTINENGNGYVHQIEKFKFLPGVLKSLKLLSKSDYKVIIITNQSGIGRGYYTQGQYNRFTKWLVKTLKNQGIRIDRAYHCPHLPEAKCDCRKPKIGLFLKAVSELEISLNDSWLIGDSETDVLAGRNANIKTIKLGNRMTRNLKLEPNWYASNFSEAVKIILG